jgi:hypothetical protein
MSQTAVVPVSDASTDPSLSTKETAQGAKAQSATSLNESASPAAVQTSVQAPEVFSATEVLRMAEAKKATATKHEVADLLASAQTKAEASEVKKSGGNAAQNLAARMVWKHTLKKFEKQQKNFDVKQKTGKKAAKAISNTAKIGLIISLVGLVLILLGQGYIGGIALVVGLVVLLLALLEVI